MRRKNLIPGKMVEPSRGALGFTLIEVLVALAIIAVAMAAALRAVNMASDSAFTLKQRLLAHWVAQDRISEYQARRLWPSLGTKSGSVEQAGLKYSWQEAISATPNPLFRKIEVTVSTGEHADYVLARLTGYLVNSAIP